MARIFNTYGPRMHPNDGRVVSNFIVQALRGEDITIYGDGLADPLFCYVDDLVEGMMRLMDTDDASPARSISAIRTNFRCASSPITCCGSRSSSRSFTSAAQDDPRQRRPISSSRRSFSMGATVQLEEGLKRTIAYFEELLAKNA